MNAVVFPSISDARLPAVYQQAVNALAECSRCDECQDWADKAQAMASYARQAKDDTMRKMADRIQARAIRRCGELLRQVPPANGSNQNIRDGDDLKVPTRQQVATDAGMSERQRKTALRVAEVPLESFEAQVESATPPTVTALAKQGTETKPRPLVDLGNIEAVDYARATEAMGILRRFADYCGKHEPQRIAHAIQSHEVADTRAFVETVDAWLDAFIVNLRS